MNSLNSLRIVFMGTPDFATASLEALLAAECNVVGVITSTDKPAGRGLKMTESSVKKFALSKDLKILQPANLKDPLFLEALRSLRADLQVVVAFRMLPELVWAMPALGTINVHGSLLPQYRGAAPINWAIINGEKKTGVTTFKLQQAIDTGNILLQRSLSIGENETAGEVHDRMKFLGAAVLVETLEGLADGTLTEISQDVQSQADGQDTSQIKLAPKILTETCKIDWNGKITDIHNLIRGLSPFPTAFTILDEKILKIFQAVPDNSRPAVPPGQYITDGKTFLKFAAIDGLVEIKELQLEGKKRMTIAEFLRGYKFK